MAEAVAEITREQQPFDPDEYILLIGFGGQLEPKINRELMANGHPVQRILLDRGEEPDLSELDLARCRGVIFSGGNDSVYDENARRLPAAIMDVPAPKLGICYGQQALVHELGGAVEQSQSGEYGSTAVEVADHPLFRGFEARVINAIMSHGDVVVDLPLGFRSIAQSEAGIAAVTNDSDIYAVQFHPEAGDTEHGTELLLNFARNICGMQPEPGFTDSTYRMRVSEQITAEVEQKLGPANVYTDTFQSGGVDSATGYVKTVNVLRAIGRGDSIGAIYVDNGLMRHEDGDTIRILNDMGYSVETQDWSHFFLHEPVPLPSEEVSRQGITHLPPMDSVTDAGIMRKIVKYGFLEVQRRNALKRREQYPGADIIALVQGTNLADKIESGEHGGAQITDHHNAGIEEYLDLLYEPLASLFKGDIRQLALELGLPPEIVYRQPFPGPGLCVRIPANGTGETIWPEDIDDRRRAVDRICKSMGRGAISGCWLPFEARGTKGDKEFKDYVTLLWGDYDPELIDALSLAIPRETDASRVLYTAEEVDAQAITGVRQMVEESTLEPLKDLEAVKSKAVVDAGLTGAMHQHYVASLPVSLSGNGKPTAMTRMFRTGARTGYEDYLTGEALIGGRNVEEAPFRSVLDTVDQSARATGYDRAVYDASHKPPGKVELA